MTDSNVPNVSIIVAPDMKVPLGLEANLRQAINETWYKLKFAQWIKRIRVVFEPQTEYVPKGENLNWIKTFIVFVMAIPGQRGENEYFVSLEKEQTSLNEICLAILDPRAKINGRVASSVKKRIEVSNEDLAEILELYPELEGFKVVDFKNNDRLHLVRTPDSVNLLQCQLMLAEHDWRFAQYKAWLDHKDGLRSLIPTYIEQDPQEEIMRAGWVQENGDYKFRMPIFPERPLMQQIGDGWIMAQQATS